MISFLHFLRVAHCELHARPVHIRLDSTRKKMHGLRRFYITPSLAAQLEAEPIKDNRQLWEFQVRSRDIDWRHYVQPLDASVRSEAVYLDRQVDFVGSHRRRVNEENRRELLVCHDMMGNYLEDRHFHSSEKFDDYRFLHWSAVDYFCYFSHEYVTIPPCGWINAGHRHGVPVLGTFIVEAAGRLDEVLATRTSADRTVEALTRLCQHFGFEGWLVNVEVEVPATNMANLYYFLRQLTDVTESRVPHGRVFWYDSVLEDGKLQWQNELNARNAEFFRRSHATLINYAWDEGHLRRSAQQAEREKASLKRIFMGLDVFGRSRKGGFQSLESMRLIAEGGFSAGIFAPAWSFETLNRFGYNIKSAQGDDQVNDAFLARNEAWWARIWPTLATHSYRSLPFYTDFCVGSGKATFERGVQAARNSAFFNLNRQSLQPSVPLDRNAVHNFATAYSGGSCLTVINYERAFRLFVTDFELLRGVLLLAYAFKNQGGEADLDVVARVTPWQANSQDDQFLDVFCGDYPGGPVVTSRRCYLCPLEDRLPLKQHLQLPQNPRAVGGGWQVRYYLAKFDGPVRVQDIGIKSQRRQDSKADTHLGAIYVNEFSIEAYAAVQSSSKLDVPVYAENFWKDP
ncbi:uncharacterized protein Dana_GF22338, isoform B [Drosophila ananassae]|uniref:Uncharacterized protein, isoform B n=1 Tax=Drosophila ananassae TaxID=7217 RepID=A0A0P8ZKY1_DROAN|nr:cytosolic endo-beta-N-acetylglucosaminidase isoform X3 [Drosophila ananassae]XP_032307868.1 cytosolic endo-beta-N-acetylglucosaminidase isoform X3 [Drosophila ananassae]KPU75473.1 uncharacterized protein Dana_GF22338, isoform B [Drosophila ananassae]